LTEPGRGGTRRRTARRNADKVIDVIGVGIIGVGAVAGDIIRTVAISPSFTSVGILAIIVGIRTPTVEIAGRWPRQPRALGDEGRGV
jgi:hypothetical protein